MTTQAEKAITFRALHVAGNPLRIPNPWDAGSAKVLASLGFSALASTSGGHAATLGRLDGNVQRDEAIAHAQQLVSAVDLPVSADLENGFADDPAGVATTIELAIAAGLAGGSIEDYAPAPNARVYELAHAAERVAAAAEVAHRGPVQFVLTARAENYLRGNPDLGDTIARLQAYQSAGADVLYAPALTSLDQIRSLVASVDRPVNVLAFPGAPNVAELASVGVARVSVGSAFSAAAIAAYTRAAREFLDEGTYGFYVDTMQGMQIARAAFAKP